MHFADMFANIYLVGKILYRQSFASKIKMTVLLINWKSKLKHCTVDIDKSGWAYRSVVAYLPSVCKAVDLVSRTANKHTPTMYPAISTIHMCKYMM